MPKRTRRANAAKSAVRSKVEHVFAQQKARMGITIRTIGLAHARATIALANLVYNMTRWQWLQTADLRPPDRDQQSIRRHQAPETARGRSPRPRHTRRQAKSAATSR